MSLAWLIPCEVMLCGLHLGSSAGWHRRSEPMADIGDALAVWWLNERRSEYLRHDLAAFLPEGSGEHKSIPARLCFCEMS